ncbi:MAG: hypothetical protein B7X03_00240 [Parcubacteria group bacterium 21-58-10]|nr:MAG: hypothetical protein B7X03_00240 [Parcubacteria group bacterium 21-58-10]
MATKAIHTTGDISRKSPSLCVVYGEDGDDWVGRFLSGFGFFDVHFPKKTTRELTREEKKTWNGAAFGVGGRIMNLVVFPGFGVPRRAIVVKTRNSVYRLGKAERDGTRTIVRDDRPLGFSTVKISFLKIGRSMLVDMLDGSQWKTSSVLSVESGKIRCSPRPKQS